MKVLGIELPPPLADAVRACRPHLMGAAIFSALLSLLLLAPALYMLQVYDRVLATGGRMTLLFITIALAVALITLSALDAIRGRLLVRAGARLNAVLGPQVLHRMLSSGGRENVQAMRDLDTVRQTVASPATAALFDVPFAPVFVVACFLLHFWLGMLAVASIALLLVLARRHQQKVRSGMVKSTRALAASHAAEQSAAANAGTMRALGMVGAMVQRQLSQRRNAIGDMARAQFTGSGYTAVSRFLRLFVQSFALGLGALLALDGQVSAGAIIAASILIGRALQPIDALINGWAGLASAHAALGRLAETFANSADFDRARTGLPAPSGKLEVDQVSVRGSDQRAILAGITFTADPGEILGIIGPSGSGKTTLAKVIAGALVSDLGVVRFDGAQRSDWEPDALGRFIGYLPQEPSLFEGTIKDNIARFATSTETDAEAIDYDVVAAAKAAGVHEMILRLPQGYDTQLGPMGNGLSAGQSQRIALARALFRDPTLLIFDEPNAFLDAQGEAALRRALNSARKRGATILVIAHRRSVLEGADRLLVLEDGRPKMLGPMTDVVVRLGGGAQAGSAA